jgi:alkylation response protein AidB-like acyl-CoA dehydrogenase
MMYHPAVQQGIAQMVMEVEAIGPYLDRLAEDWTSGVDHGMAWPLKIVAAKHRAVESAWKVADTALDLAGGFGIFAASGIERLFRDARLGRIHPASPALAHEIVGKLSLWASIPTSSLAGARALEGASGGPLRDRQSNSDRSIASPIAR